ncbi:hypothetical protein VS883_28920, partial [Escherichia coli]
SDAKTHVDGGMGCFMRDFQNAFDAALAGWTVRLIMSSDAKTHVDGGMGCFMRDFQNAFDAALAGWTVRL